MIRLPRPSLPLLAVGAPVVSGIATGAAAVTAGLAHDWRVMVFALLGTAWAMLAAAWAYRATTHACPPVPPAPEPVQRGLQCVHFIGGPEDGGQAIVPLADRDLHRATLNVEGADYAVGDMDRTCYRAELAPAEAGGDR